MLDDQAASCPEWQSLDTHGLIGAARRSIRRAPRARSRIPHRPRRHHSGRGDVLIEKRWRHRQHARDVVEPVRFVVFGQQRGRVDAHAEQILDGVRIFGTVQTMERNAAGIRIARCRRIQLAFESGGERLDGGRVGPPCTGWRHHPAAQLAQRLLPQIGVLRDVTEVGAVERDARRLHPLVVTGNTVGVDEWCEGAEVRGCDRA
jgi:hypothetical protein